jgi:hypothetical protein
MSKGTQRLEISNKARRTLLGYFWLAAATAVAMIIYSVISAPAQWAFPVILLVLLVVNTWLWLTRYAVWVELRGTTLRWRTLRTSGQTDVANIRALRPFSVTPFLQVCELRGVKRTRFFVIPAISEYVALQAAIGELRPDLKMFVPKTVVKRATSDKAGNNKSSEPNRQESRRARKRRKRS